MTRSLLPAGLEVNRPSKRLRRSSSTSSTSLETLQTQALGLADNTLLPARLAVSREEVPLTPQSSLPPLQPALNQLGSLRSPRLPFPLLHDNTLPYTLSEHSTESGKGPERPAFQRELGDQSLNEESENGEHISRSRSSSNVRKPGSSVGPFNSSEQNTKEQTLTPHSLEDLGSSQDESEADNYTSESESSNSGEIMPQETPLNMRDLLNRKMLFINEKQAKAPGEVVVKKASAILDGKRGSDWGEEKKQDVQEGIEDYCEEAEATFVMNLMEHILGKTRKVPKNTMLSEDELEQKRNWIEAAWKKDHLRMRSQINFRTDCIPSIRTGIAFWDKLVAQAPRVENPKPDMAFGIYKTAFSPFHQEILNNHRCNLAGPKLYDIFLAFDAKCMNASIDEAKNQCMRSGCAMVQTRRRLNQAANQSRKKAVNSVSLASTGACTTTLSSTQACPRADTESFAFTLAIGSQGANMFINWALEMDANDNNNVQWHMHKLRVYSYFNLDDLAQLHHDIDNILDWGLTTRKAEVENLCEKIHSLEAMQPKAKKQKKTNDDEEDADIG